MIGHGVWWGQGWGLIGLLLMVAFWTLVVVVILALVRGRGAPPTRTSTALRVLEDRYARGEIDREEFLERRATLTGERGEPGPPPGAT